MLEGRCQRLDLDAFGLRGAYRVASCRACLRTVPGRLLTVVATERLAGGRRGGRRQPALRAAFYSTAVGAVATAAAVLGWYGVRWSEEVTFRDAKQDLGCGQPQGWTREAVRRSAPTLMLLYSLVVLWFAREGHRHYQPPPRPWYPAERKTAASFADMLAALRACCLRQAIPADPPDAPGPQKWAQTLLAALLPAA
jgi:hypothetical protein